MSEIPLDDQRCLVQRVSHGLSISALASCGRSLILGILDFGHTGQLRYSLAPAVGRGIPCVTTVLTILPTATTGAIVLTYFVHPKTARLLENLGSKVQQMFRYDTEASTVSVDSQSRQALRERMQVGRRWQRRPYSADTIHRRRSNIEIVLFQRLIDRSDLPSRL
jgi:hypothetical protein